MPPLSPPLPMCACHLFQALAVSPRPPLSQKVPDDAGRIREDRSQFEEAHKSFKEKHGQFLVCIEKPRKLFLDGYWCFEERVGDLDFCPRGGKSPPSPLLPMCAELPHSGGAGLPALNRFPLNAHPGWIIVENEEKCSAPSFLLVNRGESVRSDTLDSRANLGGILDPSSCRDRPRRSTPPTRLRPHTCGGVWVSQTRVYIPPYKQVIDRLAWH